MEAFFTASKLPVKNRVTPGSTIVPAASLAHIRGLSPVAASRPPSPLPKNLFKTKKPLGFPKSFFFRLRYN